MFPQAVIEKLGYYVYFLKDPRDKKIFYVGKGKGNRIFAHVNCAIEKPTKNEKIDHIRNIIKGGHKVEHYILRHGLSEDMAFELESAVIEILSIDKLTNLVLGHDIERGIKTTDEIIQYYDAKVITISEPSIIININKLYKRFMSETDLYNSTRSSWVLGPKREKAKYAFAAYKGLVREVYRVDHWQKVKDKRGKTRYEFEGQVAEKDIRDKYLNGSFANYVKFGAQNPIKYVNC